VAHQAAQRIVELDLRVDPQAIGRLLERLEVIAVTLQEVPDLLRRQARRSAGDLLHVVDLRREHVGRATRVAKRSIQAQHRAGDVGRLCAQLVDLTRRDGELVEERIAERLGEIVVQLRRGPTGQLAQLDVERLRELEQQRRGHGALVVLDEVHVRRRDAERARQLALRDAVALSQAANLRSECCALRHGDALHVLHFRRPRASVD
jgi:hypothetical protein